NLFIWLFVTTGVYITSQELIYLGVYFQKIGKVFNPRDFANDYDYFYSTKLYFHALKIQLIKIGLPILWGIISFILLVIGIKRELKQIRIIALSLLGLTILKLFIYDISNVSETGKIVSFILLGVLILLISF